MHRFLLASLLAASAAATTSLVSLPAFAQNTSGVATTRTTATPTTYDDPNASSIDPVGWSAALLLGLGVNNDVGFGLGARGGYTLDNHVYIGGTLLDHFGSGLNLLLLGGEGGYDFIAGPVMIRAYGGLGFALASVGGVSETVPNGLGGTTTVSTPSQSATNIVFWPGVVVTYTFPQNDRFFVGGDARVYIVSDFSTFALYGFGGMHF
jgi:hypothetical protein